MTLGAAASAVTALALAAPATAVMPARDCPDGGPFVLMTRAQLDVLALEVFGSTAPNEALMQTYDKNGDAKLCVQHLENKTRDTSPYNFVDNTAR
jgi:hypothetical protein